MPKTKIRFREILSNDASGGGVYWESPEIERVKNASHPGSQEALAYLEEITESV